MRIHDPNHMQFSMSIFCWYMYNALYLTTQWRILWEFRRNYEFFFDLMKLKLINTCTDFKLCATTAKLMKKIQPSKLTRQIEIPNFWLIFSTWYNNYQELLKKLFVEGNLKSINYKLDEKCQFCNRFVQPFIISRTIFHLLCIIDRQII